MNRSWVQKSRVGVLLGALAFSIVGCGGGSTAPSSGTPPAAIPQNVQPITVETGPANNVNLVFTDVTICAPDKPSDCHTIEHVLVDTGSVGLRIMASVLPASLVLPQQTDGTGKAIVECTRFADGYSWGPIKAANIRIAGETANAVPIQIIGHPDFPAVPSTCSSSGPPENTVQTFGSNGVLGVGSFVRDCGPVCTLIPHAQVYFACSTSGCESVTVSLAQQVPNPVALFAVNNNGLVISLPSVPPEGAVSLSGSMLFGIGTQANNGLGNAKVLTVDPATAEFTTIFNNKSHSESFIDSGSNGIFFPNDALPVCSTGFFCPATTQNFSAVIQAANGSSAAIDFRVANSSALFAANNGAFSAFANLAGPNPNTNSFDWGLPFFFGRTVFTAIEGKSTPAGIGPYVAF